MTKRIMLSILAMGIIALMVSAASFAYFSDFTKNEGNSFATGHLDISTNTAATTFSIPRVFPGDIDKPLGTWTVSYDGIDAYLGLQGTLGDALNSCGLNVDVNYTYDSTDHDLALDGTIHDTGIVLSGGESFTVSGTYTLPATAGNECQDKSASLDLAAYAIQKQNVATPNFASFTFDSDEFGHE